MSSKFINPFKDLKSDIQDIKLGVENLIKLEWRSVKNTVSKKLGLVILLSFFTIGLAVLLPILLIGVISLGVVKLSAVYGVSPIVSLLGTFGILSVFLMIIITLSYLKITKKVKQKLFINPVYDTANTRLAEEQFIEQNREYLKNKVEDTQEDLKKAANPYRWSRHAPLAITLAGVALGAYLGFRKKGTAYIQQSDFNAKTQDGYNSQAQKAATVKSGALSGLVSVALAAVGKWAVDKARAEASQYLNSYVKALKKPRAKVVSKKDSSRSSVHNGLTSVYDHGKYRYHQN
ncbi:MAG: hypothetical protein R3A13_02020 [Bdellovibrionota bacterium]